AEGVHHAPVWAVIAHSVAAAIAGEVEIKVGVVVTVVAANAMEGQPQVIAIGRLVMGKADVAVDPRDHPIGPPLKISVDLLDDRAKRFRQRQTGLSDAAPIPFVVAMKKVYIVIEANCHKEF